jgi:predicted flap endonuclease-1-like 5' DNA nuclease
MEAICEKGGGKMRTALGALVGLVLAAAGVGLFAWLLWWLWSRFGEEKAPAIEIEVDVPVPEAVPEAVEAEGEEEEAAASDEEEPAVADDLKRIEGIGPKISSVLQEAGITTYIQLADAGVSRLEEILEEADPRLMRLANPATWPEQAALAAAGEWDALQALQNELKGGRRG